MLDHWSLPLQGRKESEHLYRWIYEEEEYVTDKFDDGRGQRADHDRSLREFGLHDFWHRQIVQYYDRAEMFLSAARTMHKDGNEDGAREMEMRAKQAIVKGFMTAKGLVESSIRVFGPLPKPGVPSGQVENWEK